MIGEQARWGGRTRIERGVIRPAPVPAKQQHGTIFRGKMTMELARAAGADTANAQARQAGRVSWNEADYDLAVRTMQALYPEEMAEEEARRQYEARGVTASELGSVQPKHPAPFPQAILDVLRLLVPHGCRVIDPMGGIGRAALIGNDCRYTICEIESEWANQAWDHGAAAVIVGDSRTLPVLPGSFDCAVCSPCYGNRLADSDAAQRRAGGAGEPKRSDRTRRTYRGFLGRDLSPGSGSGLRWDSKAQRAEYQELHEAVWREVFRVLRSGGLFLLNIKDHCVLGEVQRVSDWHRATLARIGFLSQEERRVKTAGDQNTHRHRGQQRKTVDYEEIQVWRKP